MNFQHQGITSTRQFFFPRVLFRVDAIGGEIALQPKNQQNSLLLQTYFIINYFKISIMFVQIYTENEMKKKSFEYSNLKLILRNVF